MKKSLLIFVFLSCTIYIIQAQTWNSQTDYSSINNPNGAWSYLRKTTTTSIAYNLMDLTWGTSGWTLSSSTDGSPSIQAGPLLWAKGNANGLPVVRWTCPTAGYYSYSTKFIGADSNGVNNMVYVIHNDSNILFVDDILAYKDSSQFSDDAIYFNQNDHLDLIVLWNGTVNVAFGWTQAIAVINKLLVPSKPTLPVGETILCIDSPDTSYTTSAANATSYQWDLFPPQAGRISGTGSVATVNWDSTYTGVAKIVVYGINAGVLNGPVSDTLHVNVLPTPDVPSTPSGMISLCQYSDSTTYTTSLTLNADNYIWSIYPDSAGTIVSIKTFGIVKWDSSYYGNAYIKVKATNGICEGNYSDSLHVTILQGPTDTVTTNGSTSICQGSSVTLIANRGTGYTYQWKKNDSILIGQNNFSYNANQTGKYAVVITNTDNCSITSTPIPVEVNPYPLATITPAGPITVCLGWPDTLRANTGPGYTYQWKLNGLDIPGDTNEYYLAGQAGVFTVIVTSANNCATSSAIVNVSTNPSPTPTITAHGSTSLCVGDSLYLTTNMIIGLTYQWQRNGTNLTGKTDTSLYVFQTGDYTIVATNSFSCFGKDTISVAVNPNPFAEAGSNESVCPGDSVVLNASGGDTYVWSNGVVQGIPFLPTSTNMYHVTVTAAGCSSIDSLLVTINPAPPIPTITSNGLTLTSSSATGNLWFFNGDTILGETSQTYVVFVSGIYQVQVTNSFGCSSISDPLNVQVGIEENLSDLGISIFPNPADEFITVEITNSQQDEMISIMTLQGQMLMNLPIKQLKTEIDIRNLPEGMYIIKLTSADRNVVSTFVKGD